MRTPIVDESYQYQSVSKSILAPSFKTLLVQPLIRFIPYEIPANAITLCSFLLNLIALYIVEFSSLTLSWKFPIVSFLVLAYAIGDDLDGMQARRTLTSSSLGEFLDHTLDSFNFGLIAYCLLSLYEVKHSNVFVLAFTSIYLLHSSIIFEQYTTGRIYIDRIGHLEYILLAVFLFIIGSNNSVYQFLTTGREPWDLSVIEAFLAVISVFIAFGMISVLKRANQFSFRFVIHCLAVLVIAFVGNERLQFGQCAVLIGSFNVYYIGKLLNAHLFGGSECFPDLVTPIVLIAWFINIIILDSYVLTALVATWISSLIIYNLVCTIYPLRHLWFWRNIKSSQ